MKPKTIATRRILATLVAGSTLVAASAAFAQAYAPQPRYEERDPAPGAGVSVTTGMHGDRYWDGHRYWEHDAWRHRHPRDRDPWRVHEHEHEHEHREY